MKQSLAFSRNLFQKLGLRWKSARAQLSAWWRETHRDGRSQTEKWQRRLAIDRLEDRRMLAGDPPTGVDDFYLTDEDIVLNIAAPGVLNNDTDPESDTLSVIEVDGSDLNVGTAYTLMTMAILTLDVDGSFTYDPNGQFESLAAGETSLDSFNYTISDGTSTSSADVTINVTGINDAPVIEDFGPSNVNYNEGDGAVPIIGGVNLSDPDNGDNLAFADGEDRLAAAMRKERA
ncbi:MAG: cadherin-like domain-containing protein [Planctomycetes bacterium]|nr:cadherin-like domain-containing protein [Planctomycetota bacterium]